MRLHCWAEAYAAGTQGLSLAAQPAGLTPLTSLRTGLGQYWALSFPALKAEALQKGWFLQWLPLWCRFCPACGWRGGGQIAMLWWLCLSLPPCQTWYPRLLSCPHATSWWHCRAARQRRYLLSLKTPGWQMLINCPFLRHYSSDCSTRTQAGEDGKSQGCRISLQPSSVASGPFWDSWGPIWFSKTTPHLHYQMKNRIRFTVCLLLLTVQLSSRKKYFSEVLRSPIDFLHWDIVF